jgi:hypothetical protein
VKSYIFFFKNLNIEPYGEVHTIEWSKVKKNTKGQTMIYKTAD